MTQEEKSDKVFDIINSGKPIFEKDGLSYKMTTPFDFFVSNNNNDKTVIFDNLQEAIIVLSDYTGIENTEKLTDQLTNDLFFNGKSTDEPFVLEFKVSE